jgi:hypothetical protein
VDSPDDRLVAEHGDIPVQIRGEADRIPRDDLAQVLPQAATSHPSAPQNASEPKHLPTAL